ncbi:MAG: hypothetical protein ACI4SF_09125 [Oscillospiraceae bacterium]
MNLSFEFPDDKEKEPLVSFTVSCGEKDFNQLEQSMLFKSGGAYIFTALGAVLAVLILIQIIIAAIAAGQPFLAVSYTAFALLIALEMYLNVRNVKKAVRNAPNDSGSFTYAFYRHHFTFASDYEGISESYEAISRGVEDTLEFMLFRNDGKTYLIPKQELSDEALAMLRAVMENKLGGKFTVKAI